MITFTLEIMKFALTLENVIEIDFIDLVKHFLNHAMISSPENIYRIGESPFRQ